MRITHLLFIMLLGFFRNDVSAQSPIQIQFAKSGKALTTFTLSSDHDLSGCSLKLRGDLKKKRIESGQGKEILSVTIDSLPLVLKARDVPKVKGKSGKIKFFFRGIVECTNNTTHSSNIVSFKIKRRNNAQALKVPMWLTHFGENLGLNYQIVEAFPSLQFSRLVDLQDPDVGTDRLFAVEQGGKIYSFVDNPATTSRTVFLDISSKVTLGGESGMLGLAFHPNYQSNRYFYVHYIDQENQSIIARYQRDVSDANLADPSSELILLTISKSENYHHGGQVAFGPDGYLYVSIGDGGPQGDPNNRGQKLNTLLGKLLRIDVDAPSNDLNYGIPTDNPFVNKGQAIKKEIFAYGFRNPWRFSFDSATGIIWLADVGLGAREEVNLVVKGGNYGWNIFEGKRCRKGAVACSKSGLKKPIYDYPRGIGKSVTGGYVYRGSEFPNLEGQYIFADFISGKVWALRLEGAIPLVKTLLNSGKFISSFGQDRNGRIYILDYAGKIYKFDSEL